MKYQLLKQKIKYHPRIHIHNLGEFESLREIIDAIKSKKYGNQLIIKNENGEEVMWSELRRELKSHEKSNNNSVDTNFNDVGKQRSQSPS